LGSIEEMIRNREKVVLCYVMHFTAEKNNEKIYKEILFQVLFSDRLTADPNVQKG
jgi:hypothetical protein